MIHGVIISHGKIGKAFYKAALSIVGSGDDLKVYSNNNLSTEALYEFVKADISNLDLANLIIMVDLRGGSCWRAGKMLMKENPEIKLVSGLNLPMLISFLSKRNRMDINNLVETIIVDSTNGIFNERL